MKVSINMAMSLDGKIATKARGPVKLGSAYDRRRMEAIRSRHDAVINGAGTFKAYPFPLLAGKGKRQPISAVVSSSLKILRGTPWEKWEGERWIFCGKGAPRRAMDSLTQAGVKVFQGKGKRPSPQEILRAFSKAGVRRLLLEGGGELNASFLEADLVNVVHLTLVPILVGGAESPTWCEGEGFAMGHFPRFRLKECRNVKGELYLTYER